MLACAPFACGADVDASTLRGKVMCGYQGWFRCPGDAAKMGWVHWSRDGRRIGPQTLTFEMWPDVSEYGSDELYAAPGFTSPDGKPASLFSSDNPATVLRHFEWMRDYGIDGAFLQHFVVDLPGGPAQNRAESRYRVMRYVRDAAQKTGRTWSITYDLSGMPTERIFEVLTRDWKKLVDEEKFTSDPRYLHEGGLPVVQIFGFYYKNAHNAMTAELGNQLIDFFQKPGPYRAYLVGGGDWNWRRNPDPAWQAMYRKFDAYAPWNVGNTQKDSHGVKRAATSYWAEDQREMQSHGKVWMPVVYPGFSWDNLQRKPAGSTEIARRRGQFYWEQFVALAKLKSACVYVAMFDEVDEGTAIFKVTDAPPTQAHFVGTGGVPSDWYLRLTGAGMRMVRGERAVTEEMPKP